MLLHVNDGETISDRAERSVVILTDRPELTLTWSRYVPGERGPDPHIHREHTDAFYILEGELTFRLGPEGEAVRAPAGSFVAVPPTLIHSFANESTGEARWLNTHTPDKGFAAYLRAAREGRSYRFDDYGPPPDGGLPVTEALLSGPGEGERLTSGGRLKGTLSDLCLAEWIISGPFDRPDPDGHAGISYVLEGTADVEVKSGPRTIEPNTLTSTPRLVPTGSGSTRILTIHAPGAGIPELFRRTEPWAR